MSLLVDHAGNVALGHVRNLVRNNAGDFGLALSRQQQPGMNADESSGQGKRIDLTVANDKKLEFLPCRITACSQPRAEAVGIFRHLGIIQIGRITANLAHDAFTEFPFIGRRNCCARDIAKLRQGLRQYSRYAQQGQQQ